MDESKLLESAKNYADNDDYPVTRHYLRGLVTLVEAKNARIAELERLYAESLDCQECLGKRAEAAYGAAVEAQHAAVGHWENDK